MLQFTLTLDHRDRVLSVYILNASNKKHTHLDGKKKVKMKQTRQKRHKIKIETKKKNKKRKGESPEIDGNKKKNDDADCYIVSIAFLPLSWR